MITNLTAAVVFAIAGSDRSTVSISKPLLLM
jgi:hypothetical protein